MKTDPDTAHRPRRLLVPLVALTLLFGACSSVDTTFSGAVDTTDYIAATTWLVEAAVKAQTDGPGAPQIGLRVVARQFDLEIVDVLLERPEYGWQGEVFPTPHLQTGDAVQARISAPSSDVDVEGRRIFFALQAAGDPAELEAQIRRNDGERPYAIIMMFDEEWRMIDAATGYLDQYSEVYSLYGQGRDAALALIADATAGREAKDEALAVGRQPLEVTTPGPLGEWRRALGVEGPQPEPSPSDRLEAWLVDPPEVRQLFVTDDEVIPGADRAVGVDGWVQREVVIGDVADLAAVYPWVGLRFPGVGVLGPFGLRTEEGPETGPVPLFGYFPVGVDAELVGWRSSTFPDLAAAEVIGAVPVAVWEAGDSVTVAVVGNAAAGFTLELSPAP